MLLITYITQYYLATIHTPAVVSAWPAVCPVCVSESVFQRLTYSPNPMTAFAPASPFPTLRQFFPNVYVIRDLCALLHDYYNRSSPITSDKNMHVTGR